MQGWIAGRFSVCLASRACLLSAVSFPFCHLPGSISHVMPHVATLQLFVMAESQMGTLSSPTQLLQCQPCMWCILVSTDTLPRC